MKQKYTITIADMDLNVISEAPSEEVEKVVGILDRRVRSILLKSQNCSKTEAIMLCALDLCSDKLKLKEAVESLMSELDDEKEKNSVLADKLTLLEKNIEKTEKECARLQAENKRLMFNGEVFRSSEPAAKAESVASEQTAPTEAPAENNGGNSGARSQRSRVGEMFDLLTFTDI